MAKMKICIDAGHYGKYNRSPAVKSYYESDAMWKLHLLQKKYLEQLGFEVITTRNSKDTDLALDRRGKAAKGCVLFISDHTNAVGSNVNESVDYPVVYHLTEDTTTRCDDISKEIAKKLAPVIEEVMDTKQGYQIKTRKASSDKNHDGMLNDNYYGVLNGARQVEVPGLILEHSFHTNTRSTNWLLKEENLDKLAKAEAKAIAEYFGIEEVTPAAPVTKKYYRVRKSWEDSASQIGAYESLENAKKDCKEGYTVYDWNGKAVYPDIYTLELFVRDVQSVTGSTVDGNAGPETLANTITVSAKINYKHPVVKFIQKRLNTLGYDCGEVDGVVGANTETAIKKYQKNNGCVNDGEITARNMTWKKLLGMA